MGARPAERPDDGPPSGRAKHLAAGAGLRAVPVLDAVTAAGRSWRISARWREPFDVALNEAPARGTTTSNFEDAARWLGRAAGMLTDAGVEAARSSIRLIDRIYECEIGVWLEGFDGRIEARLGDNAAGFATVRTGFATLEDAVAWLDVEARRRFPKAYAG